LAHTVHPGRTRVVTFPARLGHQPPGAHLTATSSGSGPHTELEFGPHGDQCVLAIDPAGHGSAPGTGTAPPRTLTINGFTGTYRSDDPLTVLTNGHIDLTIGHAKAPGQAMPSTNSPA
jgi:hypothetical protein